MKRIFLIPILLFVVAHIGIAQQFDVEAYKQHLNRTKNLTAEGLQTMYPAGRFKGGAEGGSFLNAKFSDSIQKYYTLTGYEQSLIAKNGFMVSERLSARSFGQAFVDIYHQDLPVFVSTDAVLHALHMSYDAILIDLENEMLIPRLRVLLSQLHAELPLLAANYDASSKMAASVNDVDIYLTVARSLLEKESVQSAFPGNTTAVQALLGMIKDEAPQGYPLFSETNRIIDFSQFTPRGHYTQSPELTNYFQAMIWIGRTELYLIPPESQGTSAADIEVAQRQVIDAALFAELMERKPAAEQALNEMDAIIGALVGEQDNITLPQLRVLMEQTGVTEPSQFLNKQKVGQFQANIRSSANASQKINSQILMSDPATPDQIVPASAFLPLGQRFIIDSYILGNVVYDRIIFENQKVKRMLPSSLDVLFALGNDAAAQLLEPEMQAYPYGANLASLRYLVDSYESDYWTSSVYNGWLSAIRTLNPPSDRSGLPKFMKTAAWWQQKMNTQLASWAQLRHDNLLYAKQSYSGGITCSYPYSLVEPIPTFYQAVGAYADNAHTKLDVLIEEDNPLRNRILGYFVQMRETMGTLRAIAEKELASEELSEAEITFLRRMISESVIGCGELVYDGWYPGLFYNGTDGLIKEDYVVADVHTAPTDAEGAVVGWVLHAGTGPLNMAVVLCDVGDKQVAYIGPVMSYVEHLSTGFKRLTDEEWRTAHATVPSYRPELVNIYLADAEGGPRGEVVTLQTEVSSVDFDAPGAAAGALVRVQNYPNPFAGATVIGFTIPQSLAHTPVTLEVYDANGVPVINLLNESLPSGNYTVRWDGAKADGSVAESGSYFSRVQVGDQVATGKMTLVRSE